MANLFPLKRSAKKGVSVWLLESHVINEITVIGSLWSSLFLKYYSIKGMQCGCGRPKVGLLPGKQHGTIDFS